MPSVRRERCVGNGASRRAKPEPRSVETLAASARKSVVMILATGRDGKPHGVGTEFVADEATARAQAEKLVSQKTEEGYVATRAD